MQNNEGMMHKKKKRGKKKNKQFSANYALNQNHAVLANLTPTQPEPIELSDDNAPKNPMAGNQHNPGQTGSNQPKMNLSGSSQMGAHNIGTTSGFRPPGTNQSGPTIQKPNIPGTNQFRPNMQNANPTETNQSGPNMQKPNASRPGHMKQKANQPKQNVPGKKAQKPNVPGIQKKKNVPSLSLQEKWMRFQNSLKNIHDEKGSSASSLILDAKQRVINQMKLKGLITDEEAQKYTEGNVKQSLEATETQSGETREGGVQNESKSQPVEATNTQDVTAPTKPLSGKQGKLISTITRAKVPRPYKTTNQQPAVRNVTPAQQEPVQTDNLMLYDYSKKTPQIMSAVPGSNTQTFGYGNMPIFSHPKGIPKSFLVEQHQNQIIRAQNAVQSNIPVNTAGSWSNMQSQTQLYQQFTGNTPNLPQNTMPNIAPNNMNMAPNIMPNMANSMPNMAPNNMNMAPNIMPNMAPNNMNMAPNSMNMAPNNMNMAPNIMPNMANNIPNMGPNNMPNMAQNIMSMMTQGNMANIAQTNVTQPPMLAPIHLQMYNEITPIFEDPQKTGQSASDRQTYSPTEMFDETSNNDELREGSESPDMFQGQKRLSAFKRLGPLAQPKKPKLTINLLFNQEQAVREVVDETNAEVHVPVHLRQDIKSSTDPIVKLYLPLWPWKRNIHVKKSVTVRNSKSVMILEREQMQDEVYDKNNTLVQVTVKDYPPHWTKEQVLDIVLDSVRGKSFIPCFIEFDKNQCKFLILKCRSALLTIHKYGFILREEGAEMTVTISQIDFSMEDVGLQPWSVLRKMLVQAYDGERKLNLSAFTAGSDISHFIYFPLHRVTNQTELVQLESDVAWDYITDLDLSHNRLTTIQGFDLPSTMPKLKHLNLSHNYIEKATMLLKCRELSLKSIWLDGNPLCHDYTDPAEYVKVIRMMFPIVTEIDGKRVQRKGEMPSYIKNYCPEEAVCVVEKFLEVFFPLLEGGEDQRPLIQDMYDTDAVLTITYRRKLRINPMYRYFNSLFLKSRVLSEDSLDTVEGSSAISKLIIKWPNIKHDPFTFTVDVIYHTDSTTILTINGVAKLASDSLAEDEHLIAFTRTLVLRTNDGAQYKIKNEMILWDEPAKEIVEKAFQVTAIKTKPLSLKLETAPDDDLKDKLINIFMKLTEMKRKPSERCLEIKEWNLKHALEYFTRLLKLDSIDSLTCDG